MFIHCSFCSFIVLILFFTMQCQHKRILNVLFLNGTRIQIRCNPITTTARQIFEAIIKLEELHENFFLGLCALVGGDFVFLPLDLKIYKVRSIFFQLWSNNESKFGSFWFRLLHKFGLISIRSQFWVKMWRFHYFYVSNFICRLFAASGKIFCSLGNEQL